MHMSLVSYYFLFPIFCRNFNKHWFRTFITISYLACHRFNYVACWNLPWQDLLQHPDEALLDYFMLDHVAHSKFNASSTPKEEK